MRKFIYKNSTALDAPPLFVCETDDEEEASDRFKVFLKYNPISIPKSLVTVETVKC
jgi:hypothetical protein